jgi:hypothetical protein
MKYKLNEIPTTGFFGWFHHHWTAFITVLVFLIAFAAALGLNFEIIHRYLSHWLYGTPL